MLYVLVHNDTRTLGAFPFGRTRHVRRMRSSIASMIQSVLELRFMRAIPHPRHYGRRIAIIFQVISVLPFSARNAFVTAYLF